MSLEQLPSFFVLSGKHTDLSDLSSGENNQVKRNMDHNRLSAALTPVASRNPSCEVDGVTLTNQVDTSHAEAEQEPIEDLPKSKPTNIRLRTNEQLHRRHKKSQSEYVLSPLRKRKLSDANAHRRSYIVESVHDMFSAVRRSQIFLERGITEKEDNAKSASPEQIENLSKTRPIHIDRRSSRLKDQLKGAAIRSSVCNKQFVPQNHLCDIITQKSVDNELARWEYLPRKIRHALRRPTDVPIEAKSTDSLGSGKTYRKIFAILLELHRPSLIWSFVEDGVCDDDLPLVKEHSSRGTQPRYELRRAKDPTTPLKCFKKWTFAGVSEFEDRQWMFLAASFDKSIDSDDSHQQLQVDHILPFTKCAKARKGGYGKVFETEIHSGHHAFKDMKETRCVVAVKHLSATDSKAAQREAVILRSMSKRPHAHPHVISLLATYEYRGEFCLIFPWAHADLERHWKDNRGPYGSDPRMARWLLEQCLGIAQGLYEIHRYRTIPKTSSLWKASHTRGTSDVALNIGSPQLLFGRHGDIKPNNILFFPDSGSTVGGVLKITDFGITRFSTDDRRLSFHDNERVPYTPTYQSPECLLKKNISTLCDIWALGCVYLEFVLWFLRGYDHVEMFAHNRKEDDLSDAFFEKTGKDPDTGAMRVQVKPCVTELIADLRSAEWCSTPFQKLLSLIEDKMIVRRDAQTTSAAQVRPAGIVTDRSSPMRIGSGTLVNELGAILEELKSDEAIVSASCAI
ncbi:kinase-like protein [Macroventuria anomochaeta]|uniref:Kinase-like protein n=1 Tax=Macroventuria anomochaeta TaxID=301207 RepID=A0ACB6S241_9PLEO|nr:kinase-like protein [Macroventuria anomochaeta]KAF2627582.1 kinase-like protein [Macroventuria anomochaeta]